MVSMISHRTSRTDNPRCATLTRNNSHLLTCPATDYMDGTISCGLKMIVRLLAIDDHEKLVTKMERCLTHDQSLAASMQRALGWVAQNDRRETSTNSPDARDLAEQRRDSMDFVCDAVRLMTLHWRGFFCGVESMLTSTEDMCRSR